MKCTNVLIRFCFRMFSYSILKGNHLNCLKTHLDTTDAMISVQMVFSLLNIYTLIHACTRHQMFSVYGQSTQTQSLETNEH